MSTRNDIIKAFESHQRHISHQTKGLTERAVQTLTTTMKKVSDRNYLKNRVAKFLLKYRDTFHATKGQTPSEVMMIVTCWNNEELSANKT